MSYHLVFFSACLALLYFLWDAEAWHPFAMLAEDALGMPPSLPKVLLGIVSSVYLVGAARVAVFTRREIGEIEAALRARGDEPRSHAD